jgi:hypothetical protein
MNKDLEEFLDRNFGVRPAAQTDSLIDPFENLKNLLTHRIKHFIRTDLDKLLQALYRIDINDKESDKAFELGDIDLVAEALSELIIKRQLKKIEYAKNFKGDL